DPKGGTFARDAGGALTGVLLEKAHEVVSAAAPKPSVEEMAAAILLAGEKMREVGICCAADMMTVQFDLEAELEAYRLAAERGCAVRIRLYLQWATVLGPRAIPESRIAELMSGLDPDRCRISGVKIFADGAIGSATAAIYGSYTGNSKLQSPNSKLEESGQLIYASDRLLEMVRIAHDAGYQIAIHSIGDRSTDLVMDAYEALDSPSRHRIEHAMILSDAQIERMARLGIFCTMQPEFLMRFGHSYRRQLGPERASKLKRFRSVIDAGIPLSFSSDRPIVGGDPLEGIRAATSRPDGFDPAENVTREEALRAYTLEAARALREDGIGELLPGQLCEFRLEL
ncbi:MAG: amidohydrolase family protein, partial [Fimbriimonadaceae bacterium]